jgi:hypothetical protein
VTAAAWAPAESKRLGESIEQRFDRRLRESALVVGELRADALTILTTCKKMGISPRAYLRDTLAKILAGKKDLTGLLPET